MILIDRGWIMIGWRNSILNAQYFFPNLIPIQGIYL